MPEQGGKTKEEKSLLEFNISLKGVNITQKLVFARYLSVMLQSGLTISEALDIIHDQASGRFKSVVGEILISVRAGNSLSSALAKFPKIFSNLFVSSAYAGEKSGTLEKNLSNIAEQLKKDKELRSKIKAAMIYPVIVIIATCGLGLAMAFLVLPKITPLFKGMDMELPFTTKILIWGSELVEKNGLLIFLTAVFGTSFLLWFLRRKFMHPITHYVILKIPIIKNISMHTNLASFCRTLATLLKSGLNIDEALEITKNTATNYYYKKTLDKATKRISQGTKLSDNLELFEKYYPKLVTSMVKVGERSGKLEETLFYLAEFFDVEVDNSTKALSTAIEPVLLITIGVAVGGMAISIISPIYQITGNVSR